MRTLLRHLLSVLLLPFVVVIIVPWTLLRGPSTEWQLPPESAADWIRVAAGSGLFLIGLGLFIWCVTLFARVGRGTLAPWDPTRALVAVGPYRHSRNPMISGVAMMLLGEAIVTASRALFVWAALFLLFNHLYFMLVEEPGLQRRLGESYRTYKANVPRWIPRLRAWTGM